METFFLILLVVSISWGIKFLKAVIPDTSVGGRLLRFTVISGWILLCLFTFFASGFTGYPWFGDGYSQATMWTLIVLTYWPVLGVILLLVIAGPVALVKWIAHGNKPAANAAPTTTPEQVDPASGQNSRGETS